SLLWRAGSERAGGGAWPGRNSGRPAARLWSEDEGGERSRRRDRYHPQARGNTLDDRDNASCRQLGHAFESLATSDISGLLRLGLLSNTIGHADQDLQRASREAPRTRWFTISPKQTS